MSDSVNVYAEAKSEYTRQLCQIMAPALQIYFLDLFKLAKEKDADSRRMLWNFQALIQEIPDWSQDKVIRETEKIQRESNCDYLDELLTAVFIAHTKVLSAIRITTKQKKLQLTIPKIDHFLHRTLRETGRLIWGNAFLFAEQGTPIDRQKNMRQIESLIQEGIQQSIRSLLPVKAILKEYLNDEAEDGEEVEAETKEDKEEDQVQIEQKAIDEMPPPPPTPSAVEESVPVPAAPHPTESDIQTIPTKASPSANALVNIIKEAAAPTPYPVSEEVQAPINAVIVPPAPAPTLIIQTEPSVSFTNMDTIFDSENPERNEISESHATEEEDIDHVDVLNLPPEPMDEFEDLESTGGGIEFEEIA
jgi:hypothetical protein